MDPMEQPQPTPNQTDPGQEGTPMDQAIMQVDSLIQNPKAITPDALMGLKQTLQDLKTVVDGEPQDDQQAPAAPSDPNSFSGQVSKFGKGALVLLALIFASSFVRAERPGMVLASPNLTFPMPKELIAESVFYTTTTCATSDLTNVVKSTNPSYGYVLSIDSANPGAVLSVYDAESSTATARKVKSNISGNVARDHFLNVFFSSGIAVDSQGPQPACYTLIYREK